MCGEKQERDELRARFTGWLKILAYRTRRKYLAALTSRERPESLENVSEDMLVTNEVQADVSSKDEFDFEEAKLAKAFSQLPERKREVLIRIFVMGQTPEVIAREWNCDIHNVYKHHSMALKYLREKLKEGEQNE